MIRISASRSEPRESVPLLFHKKFFALESTQIMERGEADLSRIWEALWQKLGRDGRRYAEQKLSEPEQVGKEMQVEMLGGREEEREAFLDRESRNRMAVPYA